jgi:DNA-binding NtrC family response regulator
MRNDRSNVQKNVLIIDDDRLFCDAVKDFFTDGKVNILMAHSGGDGLHICSHNSFDVVLLDQKLPDTEGVLLCPRILEHNEHAKIIFVTAYPSFENAVEALKIGAHDYLSKPFDLEELQLAIDQALRTIDLERIEQVQHYRDNKESNETVVICDQGGLTEIRNLVDLAAEENAPVLITGETGTGKSIIAKSIHYKSFAHKNPFISINCAALPENLIESELFGYEKGAFTGAVSSRKGIFELAEGGTLFLDEIGTMPLHLQSKLLGVLEDKAIRRVGGESIRPINVRVIAASNADLENAIKTKTFRSDLYFRLSVIRIHIPPLRERPQDIPGLCNFFIGTMAKDRQISLPESELIKLTSYNWPGNVRELKNIIERTLIIQKGQLLKPSELLNSGVCTYHPAPSSKTNGTETLEEIEKNHIHYVLNQCSGNYTKSAKVLGISLSTLKRKAKRFNFAVR